MSKRKPKTGSIFERGKGKIQWIKYYGNGQVYRESSKSTDFDDAERLLKKRLGELVTGKFTGLAVERIIMRELLVEVERDYEENQRDSLPQLRSRIKKHLMPAFGQVRAANFGTAELKRYRTQRLRAEAAPSTINRELEIVKRAWSMALKCDPPMVTRMLHFPMYQEKNTRTGFLADDAYTSLLERLPAYIKPLFVIGYHVPSRLGELTSLKWTQLDFDHDQIVLNPGTTKNKEGRRMPMFGPMKETLLMQNSIRDSKFPECPYVFFGETGSPIVDFRKAWADACKEAGVPALLFHDLRRTAARNMRRAGITENVIMKIAGWKTRSMFERYDIIDDRDLKEAAQKMEKHLSVANASTAGTISGTMAPDSVPSIDTDIKRKFLM